MLCAVTTCCVAYKISMSCAQIEASLLKIAQYAGKLLPCWHCCRALHASSIRLIFRFNILQELLHSRHVSSMAKRPFIERGSRPHDSAFEPVRRPFYSNDPLSPRYKAPEKKKQPSKPIVPPKGDFVEIDGSHLEGVNLNFPFPCYNNA